MVISEESDSIHLTIADQGMGISDQEKMKVWDQFYRIGNEQTRKAKGTGLGLYIVDKILKAHRAKIKLMDNKPNGTIVSILFPKIKV